MPIRTTAIARRASLGLAGVVLGGLGLVSCAPVTVADTSCTAFQSITFSARADTPETIAQVRAHNAAWDRLCR